MTSRKMIIGSEELKKKIGIKQNNGDIEGILFGISKKHFDKMTNLEKEIITQHFKNIEDNLKELFQFFNTKQNHNKIENNIILHLKFNLKRFEE